MYFSVQNVFWIQNGQTLTSPNLRKLYLTCPSSKIVYSKPIQNLFGHKVWAKKRCLKSHFKNFCFPLEIFPVVLEVQQKSWNMIMPLRFSLTPQKDWKPTVVVLKDFFPESLTTITECINSSLLLLLVLCLCRSEEFFHDD